MSKKNSFFVLLIILASVLYVFSDNNTEAVNNSEIISNYTELNENETNSENYTEENNEEYENFEDPFEGLNFTNVLYLTDSNYTQELKKTDMSYVLFFSPWCHFCQYFMPIYIETANYCKEQNMNITFGRIEANLNPNSSEEFNIVEFPTIYLIIKDKKFRYRGMRSQEGLLNFIKKKINNDIFDINKIEEIKEYINNKNNSLAILSTIKNKSSIIYKSFKELAYDSFDNDFLSCLSEECFQKYGEDIILFKNFDEKENSYKKDYGKLSEAKENSLDDFISIFGIEAGAFLGRNQIDFLVKYEEKKALIYVRNDTNEEDTKYDKIFKELGKELRFENTYAFVSDTGEREQTTLASAFSIIPSDLPCIFYYLQNNSDPNVVVKLYSLRSLNMEKTTKEDIKQFIKDIKNNKVRRDLYSEDPKESYMVNGLRYIVGRTFDKYITDEPKNVFLALIDKEVNKDEEILFLDICRNLTKKYEDVSFVYLNVNANEPRDLFLKNETFPIGFLYTNALKEKKIIKYVPDLSNINQNDIEMFINKNIKVESGKNENAQTDL
jgi:thiol-disulfide isomerase/thioredoxin